VGGLKDVAWWKVCASCISANLLILLIASFGSSVPHSQCHPPASRDKEIAGSKSRSRRSVPEDR